MKKIAFVGAVAAFGSFAMADLHDFPSSDSAVVGSVGFINADEVGYFWSTARGDGVFEFFLDSNASVTDAALDIEVVNNFLSAGPLNWELAINGVVVDAFSVADGFVGVISRTPSFAAIPAVAGGYQIDLYVTNEIPGGGGSHTLAYDGRYAHSISLTPAPASLALLGLGGLAAARRRR